jgi:hypothetical protein
MIPTTTYALKITFLTPLLGSQPSREIAATYLAKKHGLTIDTEEEQLLTDLLDERTTVFHKTRDETPALMNYHILGFLKEAGSIFNGKIAGIRNLRHKLQSYVIVSPRILPLHLPAGEGIDYLERPLRSDRGPMGPRVLIARSELLPEGTWCECGLEVIQSEITQSVLEDLLDYGYNHGLGQWRNSQAYGTFRYTLTSQD